MSPRKCFLSFFLIWEKLQCFYTAGKSPLEGQIDDAGEITGMLVLQTQTGERKWGGLHRGGDWP